MRCLSLSTSHWPPPLTVLSLSSFLPTGSSSSSCPLESFQCQEGGRVPRCLGQERQIGCQEDTDGCQQLGSICRNHTCRCGHSSGPCLPFERFCDRRPDCPDGSDEAESLCASLVGPLEEEEDCESDEFRCYPGAECYPLSFKCDGHPDCEDGGDEEGCGADLPETPQITPKGGLSCGLILGCPTVLLLAGLSLNCNFVF